MPEVMDYVRALAEDIGPRPATTDAEANAADFIEDLMKARGLAVERQEFECPRTYSWAYVLYHALTIGAAVASGWPRLLWPAFAVAALVALSMWMDLDTRWGLSNLMPKGPSQNIIGRHVPKARRGERLRRVIVVAHYDSARASLAFAPSMAKNFHITFTLMKVLTFVVPVAILARGLPQVARFEPYGWYVTLALSAYLLVPLLINVHRELLMRATDGANDNASGVAAMLGVLDAMAETSPVEVDLGATQPIRRGPEAAIEAEVVPEETLLEYAPAETPERDVTELPDDFEWAETAKPSTDQSSFEFDTIEFEEVHHEEGTPKSRGARERPSDDWGSLAEEDEARTTRNRDREVDSEHEGPAEATDREGRQKRRGLWSRSREGGESEGVSGWLGVGRDFDARDEGRKIGSWDQFDEEDEEEFGDKGGWAGDDPIGDPEFASNEAQRIRRRVTEGVDRALAEKEVWFVATGAEEAGTWGMRAFLEQYENDVKSAFIVNLDNLGTGNLHWVTSEGMARRYRSDRRLVSTAKKVSREDEIVVKGREYRGLSTDATPALARGFKAMSIMAFDINGRLPNWHWYSDTTEHVQPVNIERAVRLVRGIIREL